jgi:short-subunit dehydrogenase
MMQAVVTGASKGLGKAFAHLLAAQGYDLLLVARSEKILTQEVEEIKQKYGTKASLFGCHLVPAKSIQSIRID